MKEKCEQCKKLIPAGRQVYFNENLMGEDCEPYPFCSPRCRIEAFDEANQEISIEQWRGD